MIESTYLETSSINGMSELVTDTENGFLPKTKHFTMCKNYIKHIFCI